jgi:hypothetical protein
VIGERYTGGFGVAGAVGVEPPAAAVMVELAAEVLVEPAAAPPVVVARAEAAAQATTVKLKQSATKSVRNRTATSFVGLRG